jgi:hypothetical protein
MRLNLRETIAHNSFDRALKFEPLRLTCIKPVHLIPLAKYPPASIVYRLGSNSKAFGTDIVALSSRLSVAMLFSFDSRAAGVVLKVIYGLEQDLRHTAQARTFRLVCLRAAISLCEVAQSFLAVEKN